MANDDFDDKTGPGGRDQLGAEFGDEYEGDESEDDDEVTEEDRILDAHIKAEGRELTPWEVEQTMWRAREPKMLTEPRLWDVELHRRPTPEHLLRLFRGPNLSDLARARLALVLLMLGVDDQRALKLVEGNNAPTARGVLCLILIAQGRYDEVLAMGHAFRGDQPLRLEEAMYIAYAMSVALTQTGSEARALARLDVACSLADILSMKNRIAVYQVELARALHLQGTIELERMRGILGRRNLSERLRANANQVFAAQLMAVGDYHGALAAAEDSGRADLRSFALALLDRPEENIGTSRDYGRLAVALRDLYAGRRNLRVGAIRDQPEVSYARLFEARALIGTASAEDAVAAKLALRPRYVDQRVLWSLLKLEAAAHGQLVPEVLSAVAELHGALEELQGEDVLDLARRIAPNALVLASFTPSSASALRRWRWEIPILAGEHILAHDERLPVPGRSGRLQVLEAMGVADMALPKQERDGYTKALGKLELASPPINLGTLVRTAEMLHEHAGSTSKSREAVLWKAARDEAMTWAAPDVADHMAELSKNL